MYSLLSPHFFWCCLCQSIRRISLFHIPFSILASSYSCYFCASWPFSYGLIFFLFCSVVYWFIVNDSKGQCHIDECIRQRISNLGFLSRYTHPSRSSPLSFHFRSFIAVDRIFTNWHISVFLFDRSEMQKKIGKVCLVHGVICPAGCTSNRLTIIVYRRVS